MLSRRIAFLIVLFYAISAVLCSIHRGDKEDDEDEVKSEFQTPENPEWLKDLDLTDIKGRIRSVGSGVCEDAKCDGTDNDECFESCGSPVAPEDIYGCPNERTWALTFDDGPTNITTQLLDLLDKTNVKVTFCVLGAHAKQYPEIVKRAYESGHQIASHTYSHAHLMSLSNEQIVYEVRATEEAIEAATGVRPRYLRPPFGEADDRVKSILKKMGYKLLLWNVDPIDYTVHMLKDGGQRIQNTFEKIVNGTPSLLNPHKDPGFISIQHDLYKTSITQVPQIIYRLKQRGYRFMTAAECVGDKEAHQKTTFEQQQQPVEVEHDVEIKQDDGLTAAAVTAEQQMESSAHSLTFSFFMVVTTLAGFLHLIFY
jgi:peptidoglycan/xylan/chitin deacetylase (PgdA/CDA1 family)